ncbi:MAG TPA: PAS domain S-box protein [Spirochaetota bacterium]|nr:PAS domain S-box protein [Spirochaetota bacterium]
MNDNGDNKADIPDNKDSVKEESMLNPARFHHIFEGSTDGIVFLDAEAKIIACNSRYQLMLGYSREELVGKSIFSLTPSRWHEWEQNEVIGKRLKNQGFSGPYEKEYIRKGGKVFPVEVNAYTLDEDMGDGARYWAAVRDITKHKITEEALFESESRSSILMETIVDIVFIIDLDGRFTYVNSRVEDITGYQPGDLIGKHSSMFLVPEEREMGITYFRDGLAGKKVPMYEISLVCKNGTPITLEINISNIHNQKGEVAGRMGVARDVTEKRMARDALRESEEKFRALAESTSTAIMMYQGDRWTYANPAAERICGYTEEELKQLYFWDFVHPDYRDLVRNTGKGRQEGVNELQRYEFAILTKQGDVRQVELSGTATEFGGKLAGIITVIDITERKRVEGALKESEERLRALINSTPDIICFKDGDGRILEANESFLKLFDLEAVAYQGKTDRELARSTDDVYGQSLLRGDETDEKAWESGRIYIDEEEIQRIDRTVKVFEVIKVPLFNPDKSRKGLVVLGRDISDRKKAEKEIKASLWEKETLLKEIHHRVKNNMQVISSLLGLQASKIENEKVSELFNESRYRVRSMALVHEKLYRSEHLSMVNFGEYIEDITKELQRVYEQDSGAITVVTEISNVFLGVDIAIPCGLIINELLSNSMKHAFADGMPGEIYIGFSHQEDGHYRLVIRDNGPGLPPDVDFFNSRSLGLQLVNALTAQLQGQLFHNTGEGTEVVIVFPG